MMGWLQPRAQRYRFLPQRRVGGGALPWVVGMMSFLAGLALAGGIAMSSASASLTRGLERGFTVQIVEPNPDIKAGEVRAVVDLLRARPDVVEVRVLGDEELRGLLEPWLGTGNIGEDLPLPAMIDAAIRPGAATDVDTLVEAVRPVAASARVDAHAQWFAPLAGVVNVLTWLAVAIGALVTIAMAAIIALSVRGAISTYTPTIETLHMIGAEDRTISALFEYRYAINALIGAAIGVAAAAAIVIALGALLGDFGGGIAGELRLPAAGWIALLLLPVGVMLLAAATARVTVGRALKAQL